MASGIVATMSELAGSGPIPKNQIYRGNFSSYISNSKTFRSVSVSVIKSIPQKNNSKKLPGCKRNLFKFLSSD